MKTIVRNLVVLGCVGGSAIAAPFCAIGDNAELFVTGVASVSFDDNVTLAPSNLAKSDTLITFTPGLSLEFGKTSLIKGSISTSAALSTYLSNSELNSQLGAIVGQATYDTDKTSLAANASFQQTGQNSFAANGSTVASDNYSAGVSAEYKVSPKTSVGSGFSFSRTEYVGSGSAGNVGEKNYTVPVNVYYGITAKTDLSAGVSYTRSEVDNGLSYDEYYYNVGARGEFTPKLDGSFSIGYNERNGSGVVIKPLTPPAPAVDSSGLAFKAGLTYKYSEKTTFTFNADKGFTNSGNGTSTQKNTRFTLGAQNDLAVDWKLNASLSYQKIKYEGGPSAGRDDDYFVASAGATYVVNSHVSVNGDYTFSRLLSSLGGQSFTDNRVSVSVSARY